MRWAEGGKTTNERKKKKEENLFYGQNTAFDI